MDDNEAKRSDKRAAREQKVLARWKADVEGRRERLEKVKAQGILEAAGTKSAVGRVGHMTVAEGRPVRLEAIIGTDDTDHVNFLERGLRASRAVCRLAVNRAPRGTGFLVAPGLLLTNNHVIEIAEDAPGFVAEFDVQLDIDDNPLQPRRFRVTPDVFVTSVEKDFTLVSVEAVNAAGERIEDLPWLPLEPRTDKILVGEPVLVIQHAGGREKRVGLFESRLTRREDGEPTIQYTTDTEPGSSGSPAFNRSWQIVGLHHASITTDERSATGRPVVVNEGIRVSAIMSLLQKGGPEVSGDRERAYRIVADPMTNDWGGRPAAKPGARPPSSSVAPSRPSVEPELEASGTSVKVRADDHFKGRHGYDEDFLDLGAADKRPIRIKVDVDEDEITMAGNDIELKYLHYSAVMSKARRMAFYTACNIDGPNVKRLGRLDRDPENPGFQPEAAADKWFYDSRIKKEDQLGPQVFDKTKFAFGHLTRRLDPVWGDEPSELSRANDDTFHMTNCSPQHNDWNSGSWARLEDAVLHFAEGKGDPKGRRVSVVTGPVLDPGDPEILGVQCPLAYFKVVAWRNTAGDLKSAGFMQFQNKFVDQIIVDLEDLSDTDATFHVPIADIARVTSIDFGLLDNKGIEIRPKKKKRISNDGVAKLLRS